MADAESVPRRTLLGVRLAPGATSAIAEGVASVAWRTGALPAATSDAEVPYEDNRVRRRTRRGTDSASARAHSLSPRVENSQLSRGEFTSRTFRRCAASRCRRGKRVRAGRRGRLFRGGSGGAADQNWRAPGNYRTPPVALPCVKPLLLRSRHRRSESPGRGARRAASAAEQTPRRPQARPDRHCVSGNTRPVSELSLSPSERGSKCPGGCVFSPGA
jgi:hypothetical protein